MKKWFAGAVVYKWVSHTPYFMVLDSTSTSRKRRPPFKKTKFPGGMNKKHPEDLDPRMTVSRELEEETGLRQKPGTEPKYLLDFVERRRGTIQMVFYLVALEDCEGVLRTTELRDGADLLSPPYWVKANEVGRVLFETHQPALVKSLQYFGLVG